MNYIKQAIAILGITSVMSGIPAVVHAQTPQTPIKEVTFQEYYKQGVQKLGQGNFSAAIADFDRVVMLNPRFYEGFCLRGMAKSGLGDFQTAMADFNQALRLNPNHADAYNSRGTVSAETRRYRKSNRRF